MRDLTFSSAIEMASGDLPDVDRQDAFEFLFEHVKKYWTEWKTDSRRRWCVQMLLVHHLRKSMTEREIKTRLAIFGSLDKPAG